MSRGRPAIALFALGTLLGCTAFPVIESGECGNAVLEPGEDCDTFVDKSLVGAVCRSKGLPGECHFDCRVNTDGTRGVCPSGKGCADDGVCRDLDRDHPFAAPEPLPLEISSTSLTALDFDGDGRRELLSTDLPDQWQRARFSLLYFDDDDDLVEVQRFPRIVTRPVVRDVTRDGRDDLVFTNGRIGMLPGRPDRKWVPASFSSYVLESPQLRIVPVSASFVSDSFALAAFASVANKTVVYLPRGAGGIEPGLELERPLQDVVTPVAADWVEGLDSPCAEVALAFRGDSQVELLDLCQLGDDSVSSSLIWRETPRIQTVELPRGVKIDGAIVAADVDGDGHLDLLIGADGKTFVAHGDGSGVESQANRFQLSVLGDDKPQDLPGLLAAGDVTADGVADFVLPGGVLASHRSVRDGRIRYQLSTDNSGAPWTMAEVVDLNGNGLLDVIAAATGASGLTFLNGTGDTFQVQSLLGTDGPVRLMAAGDYDGDLINDVALVQGGRADQAADALTVAYGTRDRAPLAPALIAELSGVQQLGSQHDGALDDIFAASTARSDGTVRSTFTLFEGDPDRQPLAPYTLNTFSENQSLQDSQAAALIVGAFSARGTSDVVALGVNNSESPTYSQWFVPDFGKSKLPPRLLSAEMPSRYSPLTSPGPRKFTVAGAAADLEGDGFDEALWLMPSLDGSSCALLIYDIDGDAETASLTSELELGEPCPAPELRAAHLDDDDALDLLLLVGDPSAGGRRIEMLWNDGHGEFSKLHEPSFVSIPDRDIRGFSFLPAPGLRLAFVTDSELYLAAPSADRFQYEVTDTLATNLHDVRSVLAADFNADQLTDMVLADAEGLKLLKANLK